MSKNNKSFNNQDYWQNVNTLIDDSLWTHICTPSISKEYYWDFHLHRANCPKMIGLKLRGLNGKIQIYFNRQNDENQFQLLRKEFETLLQTNGFVRTGSFFFSQEEGIKLEYDGSLSYTLVFPTKDDTESYAQWQIKGLEILALFLEKVYGIKQDTPQKPNEKPNKKPGGTIEPPIPSENKECIFEAPLIDKFELGKELTEAELGIKSFSVSEYCEQVRDFGKQPLEINLGKNTYYFTKIRSKETNSYEYHLYRAGNNEGRKGEPIHIYDIAAWPMTNTSLPSRGMPEDMPFDPRSEKRNGETMPICGIENPTFNPQVIILGMNPSETASVMQDTSGTAWKNGYNALANIFLNSFLSGGYFTDVIKCYPRTNLAQANSFLNPAITNDGELVTDGKKEFKWYELYSLIITNELKKICDIFPINKKSFTFLVCGPTTYNKILNYKGYNFINVLKEFGNIYIMGRHYSRSIPLGRDTSRLESCRRIYDDIKKLAADGKEPTKWNDHRRYKFALLEDKDAHLHAYNGNPDK